MTTWKNPASGSWTDPTQWDTGAIPGPSDDVFITVSGTYRVSLTASSTAASLTIGDAGATLAIVDPGGTNSFSGDVTNAGALGVDSDSYSSEGGSTVIIGGTLTNTGTVVIGPPTNGLSAPSGLTVGGLAGTGGIAINGSGGTAASRASLDVLSAAPVLLAANVGLNDDALLEYASGSIGTIASGIELSLSGAAAFVADAGSLTANSALTGLTENDGTLRVVYGNTVAIAGNLANKGALNLDGDGYSTEGGSAITVAGTLNNTGTVVIGPPTGGLSSSTTLTVAALTGIGGISITGGSGTAASQAALDVLSAAPAILAANVGLNGDALLEYSSGSIGTIAGGIELSLSGPTAFVADAGSLTANSALTGLTENDGTLRVVYGNTVAIAGNLANKGALNLDGDGYSTEGGSAITVAGTLNNTGTVVIGPPTGGLSSSTTLTVAALAGTGGISITGGSGTAASQAALDVLSAAPAILAANVGLNGDALLEYSSGSIGTIASGIELSLSGPAAFVADAGSLTANSALTGLTENDGTLRVVYGNTVAIAGNLANKGALNLDGDGYSTEGGSAITVAGTLNNTGTVVIGPPTGGLSSSTTLTVAALTGTGGISITGGSGTAASQAALDVLSAAPAILAANVGLNGDALLEYSSGSIGTIASGIELSLSGPTAFVADAGSLTANSALTGLTENNGTLRVVYGNTVAIAGNLANKGALNLDGDGYSTEGGSAITIAGTLNNTGTVVIGPPTGGLSSPTTLTAGALTGTGGISITGGSGTAASRAALDVLSAAPVILAANVGLNDDALLEYSSGSIGTIAGGIELSLSGPTAFVADAGSLTANSALTGLTEIDGTLHVVNGASVAIGGNLLNTGAINLDGDGYTTEGGSSITVARTLDNNGTVVIGPPTGGLSSPATLTAAALTGKGGISITGSSGTAASRAALDVLSAAPAILAANVGLNDDALLEYANGQIGTIASGIELSLSGPAAFVADAGSLTANSALTGLTEIDGTLHVVNGASVAIGGDLLNTGAINLDGDGYTTEGGSGVTIAGTLNNLGSVVIGPPTDGLGAPSLLTVGALTGMGGIGIHGSNGTAAAQATFNVLSSAPTSLEGNVTLDGNSLLEYASGQIGTIGNGITLSLSGPLARIADASALTTNSALSGLAENDGELRIVYGDSLTVTGVFANKGYLDLDGDSYSNEGGSDFTVIGTLDNTGSVGVGPATGGLGASTTLTADSLDNAGTMTLYGASATVQATALARLAADNKGDLTIGPNAAMDVAANATFTQSAGITDLQGTLDAKTIDIAGGTLELNGGTVSDNLVTFTGPATLAIAAATTASPDISGFVSTDTLAFVGLTATGINTSYSAATDLTTATVSFSNSSTRTVTFVGDYTNAGLAIGQSGTNSSITTSDTASTPAIASIEQLGGNGSLTGDGAPNTYVLNLGVTVLGAPDLTASLGVLNSAKAPADLLDGSFSVSGPPAFINAGFAAFNGIAAGNADTAPTVTLTTNALGVFTETVLVDPVDATVGGVTTPLADQTLYVTGTVVAQLPGPGTGTGTGPGGTGGGLPGGATLHGGAGDGNGKLGTSTTNKGPTAILWGDVHLVDFDGLAYNFQAAGEFVLARSTVPGDSFQVQGRLTPAPGSSVSLLTMIGAAIGTDRVTFAVDGTVLVNGVAAALSGAGATVALSGGTLEETSIDNYVLTWNSGESMTVQAGGSAMAASISLSTSAAPGSVEGILGSDSGAANDFQLADGVVLPQPLTSAQLYGEYANSWRITQAESLLDYGPGQTTATFTDVNFPFDAVSLANLPAAVVQDAAAATSAAGITNATYAQQAELDYAATGDTSLLNGAAFAQSTGVVPTAATITPAPSVPVTLGVQAAEGRVTETQGGGPTNAAFSIFLTGTATHDTVVDWAITSPGTGYLGAAAFGGTLPSGSVAIAQGQSAVTVTVPIPASAFGTEPSDDIQMTITPTDGTPLFAPTAEALLVNPNPEPGLPAGLALSAIATNATFTQSGTSSTLNLGTFQQNSGTVDASLGITNTGMATSDELAGSFATSGPSAFTLFNFGNFGPLPGQDTDPAPALSLGTSAIGTFTESITVNPSDVNDTGYSAVLPSQTITVTGTVADLPAPTITAPGTLTSFQDIPGQIPGLSIADLNAPNLPMTVSVVATSGTLSTSAPGALATVGSNTNSMTLTGSETEINAALAALAYSTTTLGSGTVIVTATDADHATASSTIDVTTDVVPVTNAIFNLPPKELVVPGQYSGLSGLSITDPYAVATNEQLSLQLTAPAGDTLTASGSGGATVTGLGTGTLTISGTVGQINDYLSDGGELLEYLNILGGLSLFSPAVNGILKSKSGEDLVVSAAGGTEAKFFEVGVEDASFAIDQLLGELPGNSPPSYAAHIQRLIKIITGATILTGDGTVYSFNPEGEYVFASSTQASDSLDIQVRFQPLGASSSVSVVTQLGAQVGTDTVTFGVGRANPVWVDGAPVSLALDNPYTLSGGEVTQTSANIYQVSWNTGEVLTVTVQDQYLDASLDPGPNDVAGDIVGLGSDSTTAGNEFTLPNGDVLTQPFPESDIYSVFASAWAVPQQFSILNYGSGQTTATFSNPNFPTSDLTLADLPASVVAMAATVVANAGITDPAVAAIAEYDYLASGGDLEFVTDDANQFDGLTISPAQLTPPGSPPVAIGVIADQSEIVTSSTATTTAVLFDLYLTAASATDTVVDYTVAGNLGLVVPGGSATVAAGQTSGTFTVDLPAGSLGTLASQTLEVDLTSPGGTPLFTGSAQTTVNQTIPGPPPVPVISDLTNLGTFYQSGNGYVLDLGQIQYGEPLPDILFSIANAADAPSDTLTGTLAVASVEGYNVSGAALPTPLAAEQSYQGLDVSLNYVKFGENTETITFSPEDTNNTGFSAALPTETLTIEDDIIPPTMVFSSAFGDVHITTYNGLLYNFQAVGEFTLAQSRIPGDSFDIQLRLVALQNFYGSVSTIQAVGVSLGSDIINFDTTRQEVVWVDGAPSSISMASPIINFAGGSLTELTGSSWQVKWNTGEEATIVQAGALFNVYDGIPLSEPDQVGGLQGEDAGQSNDFQLSNGTVLPQPLSYAELYGPYADSWRISQPASLLDYGPNQTTTTFTNRNYPEDYFDPNTVPAALQQKAAAVVAADGITDPGLAQAAELDYLVTNDTGIVAGAATAQQQVAATTVVTPTDLPAPELAVGVEPAVPGVAEQATGVTPVVFDLSQTGTQAIDNTVTYTVVDNGTGFLGVGTFGSILPSGTATISSGQLTSNFTIDVPNGALGTLPQADLAVSITDPGPVFAPTATVAIANAKPEPGTAIAPLFTDVTTPSNLVANSSTAYSLNLGTFAMGEVTQAERLSLTNNVTAPADDLTGNFSAPMGSGFVVIGGTLPEALTPAQSYSGLYVTPQTNQPGVHTETLTFTPKDVNASGYSVTDTAITITMTETVTPGASEGINSPDMLLFPNVLVGTKEQQVVSVSNTASSTGGNLDVTPSAAGDATSSGTIANLAPGAVDATDIMAGLDTTDAGALQGNVTLAASSVMGGGTPIPLGNGPTVTVFGNVYRQASATIVPVTTIVHVGDPGSVALDVSNTAAADGYSESLIASLAGVSGGFTAAAAGPTGDIVAGGSDTTTLKLDFSTAQAGTVSGTGTLDLISDGGVGTSSIDGLGTSALTPETVPLAITVNNFAAPVFQDLSNVGTFGGSGTAWTLNLGTVTQNAAPLTVVVGVVNAATGPADVLTGSLTAIGSSAFTNSGLAGIGTLAAGQSVMSTVTLDTGTLGAFSETITLMSTDSNTSGFSEALPTDTLTVIGSVGTSTGTVTLPSVPPAVATVVTPTPINFGAVHLGSTEQQTLDIGNTATGTAAALDASVLSVSGGATASGSFAGLAPGATNTTGIAVGLNTGTAGVAGGNATLAFVSDAGTAGTTSLANQTIAVAGTVYREAAAALLPLSETVHVGDPGSIVLPVSNSDPADGYSENLIAMLIGTTGGIAIAAGGPTNDISAGATDTSTLALGFSTAQAGTVSGTATVGLTSDGGTGAGSIDGLGTTALASQTVGVNVTVDNFADPVLSSNGNLTQSGADSYVLNLGTAIQGSAALSAALTLGNDATGPADWLDGGYSASGASEFSNTGLAAFSDLAAGGSLSAGDITLATAQTGVFSETITLTPTDANVSGYSSALAERTITVTGTIDPPTGTAQGDVHMVTFDGLHYDFQAVGDYVLTRSTVPGDSFQIQIATAAAPALGAVSITTEAAAQVGGDVVSFAIGREDVVWVDGAPDTALNAANPVQQLADGALTELSPVSFRLTWSTGESLSITDSGAYLNSAAALPVSDGPGSVRGLLGSDSGQANDFQLADGTVLKQPLSASTLLGEFADAWQVTPAASLLGDIPMQFIYSAGPNGQTVLQATAAGQILSAGSTNVLSDADGLGVTFQGSLAALASEAIAGFSAKDMIDVSGLDSARAAVVFTGSANSGMLQVSDGVQTGGIQVSGALSGGGFHVTSDGHGGSLVTLS